MKISSTIAIRRSTRDILKEIGHKGQTYDQLISELIKAKRSTNQEDSVRLRVDSMQQKESTNL